MTYELALKLKNAGFPQERKEGKEWGVCSRPGCGKLIDNISLCGYAICPSCDDWWYHIGSRQHVDQCECRSKSGQCKEAKFYGMEGAVDWVYFPTLSELIEACGDGFKDLLKCPDNNLDQTVPKWIARKDQSLSGYGETPEESVANLWLELNKK